MIRTLDELRGYDIQATDGEIGHVEDFLFDDESWTIRYFVVDTGPWLFGRKVLIAPQSVGEPSWEGGVLPVDLTKEQVEESPEVDLEQPVSRQKQAIINRHYGWQNYWATLPTGARVGTPVSAPPAEAAMATDAEEEAMEHLPGDPHLRSVDEVVGYNIGAVDGEIGSVDDFLVEDEKWTIRYMVVDTSTWLTGRQVLVAPEWIDNVSWERSMVQVKMGKSDIESSPEYDPDAALDREYEQRLHEHYGMTGYWA